VAGLALAAMLVAPAGAPGQASKAAPAPKAPPGTKAPAPRAPQSPAASPAADKARGERGQPVTVDADKMDRLGKESLLIFTGKVVARQDGSVQHSDKMEVYLDEKGDRILRTVSTGNVRIVTRDCRIGTSQRAEYYDLEQRMVLIGDARVWENDNVVTGDTITIFLSEDRSIVQAGKQERVKLVFYPKQQNGADGKPAPAARQSCE
jgi:lipopolysaccharide export system protein LptA